MSHIPEFSIEAQRLCPWPGAFRFATEEKAPPSIWNPIPTRRRRNGLESTRCATGKGQVPAKPPGDPAATGPRSAANRNAARGSHPTRTDPTGPTGRNDRRPNGPTTRACASATNASANESAPNRGGCRTSDSTRRRAGGAAPRQGRESEGAAHPDAHADPQQADRRGLAPWRRTFRVRRRRRQRPVEAAHRHVDRTRKPQAVRPVRPSARARSPPPAHHGCRTDAGRYATSKAQNTSHHAP